MARPCSSGTGCCRNIVDEKEPSPAASKEEKSAPVLQHANPDTFLTSHLPTITTILSDDSTTSGARHIFPTFGHRQKFLPPYSQPKTNSASPRTACIDPQTSCCSKGSYTISFSSPAAKMDPATSLRCPTRNSGSVRYHTYAARNRSHSSGNRALGPKIQVVQF